MKTKLLLIIIALMLVITFDNHTRPVKPPQTKTR